MAYEFERTSVRASQALSIGTTGSLAGNSAMLQRAAFAGAQYNISSSEMMRAMATYGATSGSTVQQAAAAGGTIGLYSRAYGLDPEQFSRMLGSVIAQSQGDPRREAAGIFAAAGDAGPLGRRIQEFVGVATSALSQMQAQNPGGNYTGADAAGYVANISRLGGFYGTAGGVSATMSALSGLTGGTGSNLARMATAVSAGITNPRDLILGTGGPENEKKILSYLARTTGGIDSTFFAGRLVGQVGEERARTISGALDRVPASVRAQGSDAAINYILGKNGSATGAENDPAKAEKEASDRMAQYQKTVIGEMEHINAKAENDMMKVGEGVLGQVAKSAKGINEILDGDYKKGLLDLVKSNGLLIAALIASAIATGGGGTVGKIFGALGKGAFRGLFGAEAATAIEGALGAGAVETAGAAIGTIAGPLAIGFGAPILLGMQYHNQIMSTQQAIKAKQYGLELGAMAGKESGWTDTDKNGALGYYQMLPTTARSYLQIGMKAQGLFYNSQTMDPTTNIGHKYFMDHPDMQRLAALAILTDLHGQIEAAKKDPWKASKMAGHTDLELLDGMYYTGENAWNIAWDKVPHPEAGNVLTPREDAAKFERYYLAMEKSLKEHLNRSHAIVKNHHPEHIEVKTKRPTVRTGSVVGGSKSTAMKH